jgi:hypothetical protein
MTTQSKGLRGVATVLKLVAVSALALTPTLALAQADNQWEGQEWQAQDGTTGASLRCPAGVSDAAAGAAGRLQLLRRAPRSVRSG